MTSATDAISNMLRSPAFKFFLIGGLVIVLLVPLFLVMALVSERMGRANEVQNEVSRYWGGPQSIAGPFLIVPYTVRQETLQGDKLIEQIVERRAIFLPEELSIKGSSKAEVLHRSIFDVNVFTANATLEGRFLTPDISEVEPNTVAVRWKDAVLSLSMTGVAGLKEAALLEINGTDKIAFAPSPGLPQATTTGIHAKLSGAAGEAQAADTPTKPFTFRIPLTFTGSTSLMFAPAARETKVAITSDWPHPSFSGAFLPADRTVADTGFEAAWKVPHLARSVPNAWSDMGGGFERLMPYQFGVDFYSPIDFYDLVSRAVKYGILFLGFTFMGVFVLELFSPRPLHAVQYLFVGMALIFFYVLLLSLSEHIGFDWAYAAAAVATGGMLSLFVGRALASARSGAMMMGLLLAVYGLLYLILLLEDYALLAGALLGFIALTTIMFATLNVNWSSGRRPTTVPAE
jgi:inner membrane protein